MLIASMFAATFLAGTSPPIQNPGAPGAQTRTLSAEESVALSRTGHIAADARFMQHMIVHHNQAVEMGDLIASRTDHRGVRLIGDRIARTQAVEVDFMRAWLEQRGEPVEADDLHHGGHHHAHHGRHGHGDGHGGHHDHGAHHGHGAAMAAEPDPTIPLMPGMLSPAQMEALAASQGRMFDQLFLEGMILHHQGAIDMVDALLADPAAGQDPRLSEFLSHVIADQSAEILRMGSMLAELDVEEATQEQETR